jgi:hypothetical protein
MLPPMGTWNDFTSNGGNASTAEAYSGTLFAYYINGVQQTAEGTPTFVASARNGRQYTPETGNVQAWYPATGYLSSGTGAMAVGSSGYYWSSTFSGTNADRLNVTYGSIIPSSASSRANGFNVRCLQE